jgi:hypothetical protein
MEDKTGKRKSEKGRKSNKPKEWKSGREED